MQIFHQKRKTESGNDLLKKLQKEKVTFTSINEFLDGTANIHRKEMNIGRHSLSQRNIKEHQKP